MQRAHVTAAMTALALASLLVAPRLGDARTAPIAGSPPAEEVDAEVDVPPPPPVRIVPLPPRAPAPDRDCQEGGALVIAQELSRSITEGRELSPPRLAASLASVRSALPPDVELGVVGFAQRLWTSDGASGDPKARPWLPLGEPDALTVPEAFAEHIGICANVALGLQSAIAQVQASSAGARAVWLVVDGLHDCDIDGHFAYQPLAGLADRASELGIDVSVLVVDAWSERRGPTPLHDLVRGSGRVVHAPAWDLDGELARLAVTLQPRRCAD